MFSHSPALARNVRIGWANAWGAAVDLLFPPTCIVCHKPGAGLCDGCAQRVAPVDGPLCARCGRQQNRPETRCAHCREEDSSALLMVRGAALHTTPLREAIHAFKYDDRPELATPLARYLVAAFLGADWQAIRPQIDAVVPAPLHVRRRKERGYNQAQLLADAFCRRVGIPCRPDWLERVHFTQPQVGLSASERRDNVAQAFSAHANVAGRLLLLIDDVYTTGATLRACADAAALCGARGVYGLTLALPSRHPVGPHDTDP